MVVDTDEVILGAISDSVVNDLVDVMKADTVLLAEKIDVSRTKTVCDVSMMKSVNPISVVDD